MTVSIRTGRVVTTAERDALFSLYITPRLAAIRRLVDYHTLPAEDADDNFQDALIALLQGIHTYDPERSLDTWITTVVRNTLALARRNRMLREPEPTVSLDAHLEASHAAEAAASEAEDGAEEDHAAGVTTPSAAPAIAAPAAPTTPAAPPLVVSPDDYPTTYVALSRLSPLQRRALLLTAEGWTTADLAAELRITEGAARTLLCRARSAMSKNLVPTSQTA